MENDANSNEGDGNLDAKPLGVYHGHLCHYLSTELNSCQDNFLDDNEELSDSLGGCIMNASMLWIGPPDEDNIEIENILSQSKEHSHSYGYGQRDQLNVPVTDDSFMKHNIVKQNPDTQDFPLWWVSCQVSHSSYVL